MRFTLFAASLIALAGGPVLAQVAPPSTTCSQTQSPTLAQGQRPIDVGPFTPDANAAYQGGGVVLQGAPGAPAPLPEVTPRGEMPANAVPMHQ